MDRLLRRIFGQKGDEILGGWRKLHNEELHNFVFFGKYNQNNKIKEDEMVSSCSTHGEKRNEYRVLLRKPERRRPLGRPRRRREGWI
jgi:hypothetical protein